MTEESEFELTKEDFISLDLQAVMDGIERKDCHYYSSAFYKKSNEITDAKEKEIFLIFAFLMTSQLRLDSSENPFANIDRFNDKHLKFFSEIIDLVTDDEIKSRIADVLWLRNKNHKMAEIAVFAYLNSAKTLEDFEHWTQTQRRIERALQLASILGKKREPYQKVLERIYDLLDRCNGEDPFYLSSELMRLLQVKREGDAKKYSPVCEKLALRAELQNDFEKARKYWTRKATWHYLDKDESSAREARLKIAETYEKESEFYFQTRQPKYSMASHPLEQAIITYQNLGGLSEKVEELKLKLREYQKKAVTELLPIPGEDINITELVITAEKAVTKKSFIEAIKSLATLFSPNNVSYIRKQVEENREKYIFKTLFPNKLFGSGGRIIAVQPSAL